MIIQFTKKADLHFADFKKSGDKQIVKKIKELLNALEKDPYNGVGQPEALKYGLTGAWSRRINREHRLVYEVNGEVVNILSLKGHY